jgi:hypothetical protein
MSDFVLFDRSPDSLYFGVPLRYAVDLPVLGIPVKFESNSPAALDVVEGSFGTWRALHGRPELIAPEGVRVRLIVHDGDEGGASHPPLTCRMPDRDRYIVHTPGSLSITDCRRREAVAYVTPALLADRAHVQYGVVEGMALCLVTACGRYPLHAAAIARGDVALLLAGPPGTGKSTLAYQAGRGGFRVLSDDSAYVQLEPVFRLWGRPGRVYLPPSACSHFPELAGRTPSLLTDGSEKAVVPIPAGWEVRGVGQTGEAGGVAPVASRVGVCLLERTGGGQRAPFSSPASPQEVQSFLKEGVGISRVRFGDELDQALARVAGAGGWRLSLSQNPADALPFLEAMLVELERRG